MSLTPECSVFFYCCELDHLNSTSSLLYPCKFGRNPSTGSQDIVQTRKSDLDNKHQCWHQLRCQRQWGVGVGGSGNIITLKYRKHRTPNNRETSNIYFCCFSKKKICMYSNKHSHFNYTTSNKCPRPTFSWRKTLGSQEFTLVWKAAKRSQTLT